MHMVILCVYVYLSTSVYLYAKDTNMLLERKYMFIDDKINSYLEKLYIYTYEDRYK